MSKDSARKKGELHVEALFEGLSPYFREEYEFFNKLSQILNKVLSRDPFNDEESHIVSLDKPFLAEHPPLLRKASYTLLESSFAPQESYDGASSSAHHDEGLLMQSSDEQSFIGGMQGGTS